MKSRSETAGYLSAIANLGSTIFLHKTPVLRQYLGLIFIAGGLIWFSALHLRTAVKKSKK